MPPSPQRPPEVTPGQAPAPMEPLLLEVEGMKCGGCVRAVERRLLQQPGVRQASVNLLTRTAWVAIEGGAPGGAPVDPARRGEQLADLLASVEGLGFQARLREDPLDDPRRRRELQQQRHWWRHWRQLVVALSLLLISALGHLADAGQLPWRGPSNPLASPWFHALVASIALAGPGRSLLLQGVRSALFGMPGMDTLVGLGVGSAYLSSLVGWLRPESGWPCFFHEPVMLLGFVLTGRFLEERARYRTGRAIEELAALQPDHALLLLGDDPARQVRVGVLRPGDRVRLLPGDRVPVDGVVLEGTSTVDLAALTGESQPLRAVPGSELDAGGLNLEAPLVLAVRRSGDRSAIARIVRLVEQAQARRAPIQGLADRMAARFTLVVLVLAAATFLFWWLWGAQHWPQVLAAAPASAPAGPGHAMHAAGGTAASTPLALALQLAIAVLVVACPCALGLATPAAISVGSGLAARSGLLFRGGDAIEIASRLQAVLFDKTGTLTIGRPRVSAVEPVVPPQELHGAAPGPLTPPDGMADRLVQLAASLEQQSRHPLAHALLREAERRGLPLLKVAEVRMTAGEGLEGRLDGPEPLLVRVGRPDWLARQGVRLGATTLERPEALEAAGASLLAVAEGQTLLGLVAVEDSPRPEAAATVERLRRQGLRLGLLSGDRRVGVERLAARVGLQPDELAWDLRPEGKLGHILRERTRGPVAMVGDGINDAPALAAADLGIAVGTGTQIAQEAADLVVMGDRLDGLVQALRIARRTMAKVHQNLWWAFGYNLIVLPIAAGALLPGFGVRLSPPLAALLMALSSITVLVNALTLQDRDDTPGEAEA